MSSPAAQTADDPAPAADAPRRRVVFVSRRYGGEVGATTVRLQAYTRAVRRLGFDVEVVTRFPFAAARLAADEPRRRGWLCVETLDGCRVRRLRLPGEDRLEQGLDRVLRAIAGATGAPRILGMEAIDLLFACAILPWLLARRPDAIVVEQGPAWLALPLRLAARAGSALVLQISDVKSTAMARGLYGAVPADRIALASRLEARVWRSAARLVTVSGRQRDIIAARARIPPHAVALIPNGVEVDRIAPVDAAQRARAKQALGLSGRYVVLYAGLLGPAHDLETLVRAAALLGRDPAGGDVAVLIVGEGPRRRALRRLTDELGATNVRLLPGVAPAALAPFLAAADAGVSIERRGLADTVRAKLYLYMGAGLPILASDDGGEVREILQRAAAGVLVEPEDPAALAAAILRLRRSAAAAARFGENGRHYALAHHDRRVLADRFAGVVAEAVATRR